jgi:hypothetical protein
VDGIPVEVVSKGDVKTVAKETKEPRKKRKREKAMA